MDDEEILRDLVFEWLTKRGYTVQLARVNEAAVAGSLPVCVFLDLTVPGGGEARKPW